jgi:hypothetical protein
MLIKNAVARYERENKGAPDYAEMEMRIKNSLEKYEHGEIADALRLMFNPPFLANLEGCQTLVKNLNIVDEFNEYRRGCRSFLDEDRHKWTIVGYTFKNHLTKPDPLSPLYTDVKKNKALQASSETDYMDFKLAQHRVISCKQEELEGYQAQFDRKVGEIKRRRIISKPKKASVARSLG